MDNSSFFCLENVHYKYEDGTAALQNIHFTIEKGKKVALLGHNGAGKSTLFQLLNGILRPSAGQISFQGVPLQYKKSDLKYLRQQVGIVFQDADTQLFAGTVKQDLAFGPLNLGLSHEEIEMRITHVVAQTEIEELLEKPIHFLSVGQKKRVAIAGVLAMEPSLLLLDEPTAGLDYYYATQILQCLTHLSTDERTIVLATHDIQLAYEWADQIIVMEKGQIIYNGNPTDLFYEENIMQAAHLQYPWVFEVARALQQYGEPVKELPRTKEQLMSYIKQLQLTEQYSM